MSVFTPVTPAQLAAWLDDYDVGQLVELKGILAGIDNSNFFVTTTGSQAGAFPGRTKFVLTLFENLSAAQIPYNLELMAHLAHAGIAAPAPIPNRNGALLGVLNGKPAALVLCLSGAWSLEVKPAHCAAVGTVLAQMHVAGQDYPAQRDNTHGAAWRARTYQAVRGFLNFEQITLLTAEVNRHADAEDAALPRGAIHADLFRDNVLFNDETIGGVIDFYFACTDTLLYDVAITVNDWCLQEDCRLDPEKYAAMLAAYAKVRPFTPAEQAAWPDMLRRAALRFWLSRLYDYYLPRDAEMNQPKDPAHFEAVLRHHVSDVAVLP